MMAALTIGKLAQAAEVNVETIRYYQRRGQRRYPAEQAKRVRFIRRAQALGFTLAEVGALLALDAACICHDTRTLAAHKLASIEQKMADLAAMRRVLGDLVRQCDTGNGGAKCPIIDALTEE